MERDTRTQPLGATVVTGGVTFRVWSPDAASVAVEVEDSASVPMLRDDDAVWSTTVPGIEAGARYWFRVNERGPFPDPYSRSQPDGVHGASQVVDPAAFAWHDAGWAGLDNSTLVIYELHVGTYTREGTFDALIAELDDIAALGVTAIELMPVAECAGTRNWGYDAVDFFSPSRTYGGASGLRRLVDAAHARGLGVLLDVVYNHFGPEGNYLVEYARDFTTDRYSAPWGAAVNYDGRNNAGVRRFAIDNACHWVREYHVDGFRFDATFAIVDGSPRHILEEIATSARAAASPKSIVLIAETHENDARYLRPPAESGFGFDAVWVDDFHHAVHTNATSERHTYFATYAGTLAELAATINGGWLFDGRYRSASGYTRGTPSEALSASSFVYAIQNHDQIGNRAFGDRLSSLISADEYRAWSALHLLLPETPLLFMGQEFAATTPFLFFTDLDPQHGRPVTDGRQRELGAVFGAEPSAVPDPQALSTFERSKLRLEERDSRRGRQTLDLYRDLLRLRREDQVLRARDRSCTYAQAAGRSLLLVDIRHGSDRRLVVLNHGGALDANTADAGVPPEIAAPAWRVVLSTDDVRYGGNGGAIGLNERRIIMPAMSAALLSGGA